MEILLCLIYAAIFILLIFKMKFFNLPGVSRILISGVFVLKIIFGVLLWAIYTFYYTDRATADIYKYFDDSKIMYEALFVQPLDYFKMLFGIQLHDIEHYFMQMNHWYRENDAGLYNDSHSIIRFNALVRLFSLGYYNVHTVFICFISLIGLIAFYKTFIKEIQKNKKEIFMAVFLLPSILFWGSGVLKDGLLLFTFGLTFYFFIQFLYAESSRIKSFLAFIFFAFLLSITKPYIFIAIVPGMAAYCWVAYRGEKHIGLKFLSLHLIYFSIIFNMHYISPGYNVPEILHRKQGEFFSLVKETKPGSYIQINKIDPDFNSLLKNTPQALSNTFFNPSVLKAKSPIVLLAAVENIFIMLIILISLLSFDIRKPLKPLFYFAFFFVILVFTLIGITTPIVGAMVRYKAIASMFLLIGLLTFYDQDILFHRFSLLLKKVKRK